MPAGLYVALDAGFLDAAAPAAAAVAVLLLLLRCVTTPSMMQLGVT
jgi:hypothetical protein